MANTEPRGERLTRRDVLVLGAGAIGATVGALWIRPRPDGASAEAKRADRIAAAIHEHFDYLTLEPGGVVRFVDDWQRVDGPIDPAQVPYMKYLLSTDFFAHGQDEKRTVRYVTVFDPYASPCFNPMRVAELG